MPTSITNTINRFVSLSNTWSAAELNAGPGLVPFLAVQIPSNHSGFEITAIEWGMHAGNSGDNDAFLPYCMGLLNIQLDEAISIPAQIGGILTLPPVLGSRFPRIYLELGEVESAPPATAQLTFRSKDRLVVPITIPSETSCVIAVSAFVYNPMGGALAPYLCVRGRFAGGKGPTPRAIIVG